MNEYMRTDSRMSLELMTETPGNIHLPDVADHQSPKIGGNLDRVGMQEVELPLKLAVGEELFSVPARLNLYVDLVDHEKKGIHMSRLYRSASELLPSRRLDFPLIEEVLNRNLESHEGISQTSAMDLHFELMTERPSLLSGLKGWRSYPISISSRLSAGRVRHVLEVTVSYSSTCPCSASLARQLIQRKFERDFAEASYLETSMVLEWLGKEESICATPHSQRSTAHIKVEMGAGMPLDPINLIDKAEEALSTPVQAMVKREDEQEFARLNGHNLMFCEDAARRLKSLLDGEAYADFQCEVRHMESLHPHDAVAMVTKGLSGGFGA